jgi:tetratricopeptide (TPR) repeat protein
MRLIAVTVGVLILVSCTVRPEPGAERGPCRPQGACNAGLTCLSDVCVKLPEDLCAKQRAPGGVAQPKTAVKAREPDRGVDPPPLPSEQDIAKARALLKQAQGAYVAGDHRRSILLAKQVLRLKPGDNMATQILGASSCYVNDVDQAKWAYERLPQKMKNLLKAICLRVGIDPDARAKAPEAPSEPSEEHLATAKRLLKEARVAFIRGKHQQAARRAKQAVKLDPGNKMAMQILGASSCYLKDVDQAKWAYGRLPPKLRGLLKDTCLKAGIELEQ